MGVRAKFVCTEVSTRQAFVTKEQAELGENWSAEVQLQPVYDSGGPTLRASSGAELPANAVEENRIFGLATPAGKIGMHIRNRAAAEQFEPGKMYYVDFTLADD